MNQASLSFSMARRPDLRDVGEDPDPRFTLANERTFLAWNRTALALIGGGLAAGQLLDFDSRAARLVVALPPIALGLMLALDSYRRWEANERALRLGEPLPGGGPPWLLSVGIAAVAVVVVVVLAVDALA
jgi:putative membrane protein